MNQDLLVFLKLPGEIRVSCLSFPNSFRYSFLRDAVVDVTKVDIQLAEEVASQVPVSRGLSAEKRRRFILALFAITPSKKSIRLVE